MYSQCSVRVLSDTKDTTATYPINQTYKGLTLKKTLIIGWNIILGPKKNWHYSPDQ
jgi:hypothetical protein